VETCALVPERKGVFACPKMNFPFEEAIRRTEGEMRMGNSIELICSNFAASRVDKPGYLLTVS
jgi:hypothetical protein